MSIDSRDGSENSHDWTAPPQKSEPASHTEVDATPVDATLSDNADERERLARLKRIDELNKRWIDLYRKMIDEEGSNLPQFKPGGSRYTGRYADELKAIERERRVLVEADAPPPAKKPAEPPVGEPVYYETEYPARIDLTRPDFGEPTEVNVDEPPPKGLVRKLLEKLGLRR